MDPNPLLSTAATAAAALVAIVGGLLVSRVVNLASERSGLERHLDDLRARLTATQTRSEDLEQRLLRWDVEVVLWAGGEQFAKGGDLDIRAMIDEADVDRTLEEVLPFVEREAERYRAIRERLAPLFADGHPGFTLDDIRDEKLILVERDDERAYELVWEALEAENPKPRRTSHPFDVGAYVDTLDSNWPVVPAVRDAVEATEHATLRRDADAAHHEVDALIIQIDQQSLPPPVWRDPLVWLVA